MERDRRAKQATALHDQPRVSRSKNDIYCVNAPICAQRLILSKKTVNACQYQWNIN